MRCWWSRVWPAFIPQLGLSIPRDLLYNLSHPAASLLSFSEFPSLMSNQDQRCPECDFTDKHSRTCSQYFIQIGDVVDPPSVLTHTGGPLQWLSTNQWCNHAVTDPDCPNILHYSGLRDGCPQHSPAVDDWEGNPIPIVPREVRDRIRAQERESVAQMIGVRAQLYVDRGMLEAARLCGELARLIREMNV